MYASLLFDMFISVITFQDLKLYSNFEGVISFELGRLGLPKDEIEVSALLLL